MRSRASGVARPQNVNKKEIYDKGLRGAISKRSFPDVQRRSRGSASHKHIPNYCALRWRARAVVSSIRPRSNSKEVPLEGHRYIEGIVFVIFAIFCEKDPSSPPEKGAAPRKALREEKTKKISEQKIAKITKSRECSEAHSGPRHLNLFDQPRFLDLMHFGRCAR